jgi:protein SCO1
LQDSFGVIAARQENTDSALGYTFDHTASVFVIDTQGRWFERFLYGTASSTVVNDVRLLLAEENS